MNNARFLHIPKTAGTTFTQILKKQILNASVFLFSGDINADIQRLNSIPKNNRKLINVYSGHAPIETGIQEVDEFPVFTFLRDPISRVESYCRHVFEGKSPQIVNLLPNKEFNLSAFLEKGFFELHNLQTKMLINHGKGANPLKISSEEAVELAINNLFHKVKGFGLVEYFDESLLLFQQQNNWGSVEYSVKNKSSNLKSLKFNKQHRQRIIELNQLDIKLYQIAKTRFLKNLKDSRITKKEIRLFKKANQSN